MTQILINGKIITVLEKVYEDKKTVYAQFLMESEAKGMEIIKVKIVNEADIQKLEKEIIKNYRLVINYEKLGYQIKAFINVSLKSDNKNEFINLVRRIPNVLEVDNITGNYDFILKVLFKDVHELETFLSAGERGVGLALKLPLVILHPAIFLLLLALIER